MTINKLSRLKQVSNFHADKNDIIIFCPNCDWQLHKAGIGKNECPVCLSSLSFVKNDNEFMGLINNGN